MATDGRAAFTRLSEMRQARSLLSAEEAGELIRQAVDEWERGQMSASCAVAFGQKVDPERMTR
jgi:hypothetical protein